MPLPIASVTSNPSFHSSPRLPMKIYLAVLGIGLNQSSTSSAECRKKDKALRSHGKSRNGTWKQESGRNQKQGWTHIPISLLWGFLVKQKQLANDSPGQSESGWTELPARQGRVGGHVTHSQLVEGGLSSNAPHSLFPSHRSSFVPRYLVGTSNISLMIPQTLFELFMGLLTSHTRLYILNPSETSLSLVKSLPTVGGQHICVDFI